MTMAVRIDQYHTTNPGQLANPRVTSVLLEAIESLAYKEEADEGEEEDGRYIRVLANKAVKGKKKAPVPRVVIMTSPQQQTSGSTTQPQTHESAPAKPATQGEP